MNLRIAGWKITGQQCSNHTRKPIKTQFVVGSRRKKPDRSSSKERQQQKHTPRPQTNRRETRACVATPQLRSHSLKASHLRFHSLE